MANMAIGSLDEWNRYTSFGQVSGVIKSANGYFRGAYATNAGGSVRYLQIFDSPVAPTPGSAPVGSFILPPNSGSPIIINLDFFGVCGIKMMTGISYGFSTTAGSYTASAPANHTLLVSWR